MIQYKFKVKGTAGGVTKEMDLKINVKVTGVAEVETITCGEEQLSFVGNIEKYSLYFETSKPKYWLT